MTPQMGFSQYTEAKQIQIDRLRADADSLFSIRQVRKSCQAMSPSDGIEYQFAQGIISDFDTSRQQIMEWGKGCLPEYLLLEAHKLREAIIEEFAVMRMASRWYQMRDDDKVWRIFALNIPFGEEGQEKDINLFFSRLNRISILTDILTGGAAEYGFEIDYTKQVPIPKSNKDDEKCEVPEGGFFKYIYPSISDDREKLQIHNEVRTLVTHYAIPDICSYLKGMAKEKRIMLPQQSSMAYDELVRMGMPTGEVFSLKTFQNNYSR